MSSYQPFNVQFETSFQLETLTAYYYSLGGNRHEQAAEMLSNKMIDLNYLSAPIDDDRIVVITPVFCLASQSRLENKWEYLQSLPTRWGMREDRKEGATQCSDGWSTRAPIHKSSRYNEMGCHRSSCMYQIMDYPKTMYVETILQIRYCWSNSWIQADSILCFDYWSQSKQPASEGRIPTERSFMDSVK